LERRLTTILSLDVVGYSTLMAADEAGTLSALKSIRGDVISPKAAEYHGRIIKLIGDGMLLEFASVVGAVAFAVDVQNAMADRNTGVCTDRHIDLRIGINLGDVIADDGDIYGDGVNVAARLEATAEPGGICVSRTVYDHVKGKLAVGFRDLGNLRLKNIPEPVRAYAVSPAHIAHPGIRRRTVRPVITGSLIVLCAVGVALIFRPWEPWTEPAPEARASLSLPDRPSIVILPFANLSDDADQEFFADGMTEDLTTDLSKISGLFVISRNSAFVYKGKTIDIRKVAEDLGVRYALEGSVRRAGDEVRINAQLIDAVTGGHLWAERYDGSVADIFNLQDRVTGRIVESLALELAPQEAQQIGDAGTASVEAHDAYLLGLSRYYLHTPDGYAQAKIHFERAIELDSNYAAAHAALAKIYAQSDSAPYTRALRINLYDNAAKARIALADVSMVDSADVHFVRSWLALHKFQNDEAVAEAERALRLNPNDVDAMEMLARATIFGGKPNEGIELAQRAMRQNPSQLARPYMLIGLAKFVLGDMEASASHIETALELGSKEMVYAGVLAAAYALLGNTERAMSALGLFHQAFIQQPDLARAMVKFPIADRAKLALLAEGLELAGVKAQYPREYGGYLPLDASSRLTGVEIQRLLSGVRIEGKGFWGAAPWQRVESKDGSVTYPVRQIQAGVPKGAIGDSRVRDNLLCEQWHTTVPPLELCSAIFRVPESNARMRWGDYVLATDLGPYPFRLAE